MRTDLHVTCLGLGARGLVDPAVEVSDAQAVATVEKAVEIGINYVDTSPRYGLGRSESFVSQVLRCVERDGYDYRVAPSEVLHKARQIKAVCDGQNVPLKAAALQFVLAHPAVASVIPGSSYPEHVQENAPMIGYPIPPELWADLRQGGLIPEAAPVPR